MTGSDVGGCNNCLCCQSAPDAPQKQQPVGSDHVVVGEEILLNKKVVAFFYRYFRRRERGDDNIEEGPPTRMSFLGRKLDSNDVSKNIS